MISEIVQDREWKLKLSFLDRKCYFSGESLKYKLCYVGTKKIHNIVNSKYTNRRNGLSDSCWSTTR